ncbi:hypothetical protein D9613_006368 [Agrocybe pediades]|uniref:Uncharacterized protein n=1 Tax=Agrocybe pediades TaxID=84607 RepID=A0A8H4QUM5_9AGAR|nr:hypothetical protein D9613_006368 [Agrocybe pediades]
MCSWTIRLASVVPTTAVVGHFPNVQKATEAGMDVQSYFGLKSKPTPSSSNSKVPHSRLAESASITPQIAKLHGGEGFRLAQDHNKADALWGDWSMKNMHSIEPALEERYMLTSMFDVSFNLAKPVLKAQIQVLNSDYNVQFTLVETKSKNWFERCILGHL